MKLTQAVQRIRLRNLVAVLALLAIYWATRAPEIKADEQAALASRFEFARLDLPTLPGAEMRTIRAVHPSLEHIAGWISSVGGAAAFADLDNDGLSNDVCLVETRSDQVIVAPAPSTGDRFAPFELTAAPLPYDAATTAPMGCLPGDYNEDGSIDLLVYYWGRTPILFLRKPDRERQGPPSADAFLRQELETSGERWFTNAATRADLDGDGHVDLFIGNYFPDGARILDANDRSQTEGMQGSMSRAVNAGRNRIYLWSGAAAGESPSVSFQDASDALDKQGSLGWTLGVGAADLDGDMLPELYVANDFGPDRLYHNRSQPGRLELAPLFGRKTLTTPNSKVVGKDSFKGMGAAFGDVNGDGLLDIYVSNIAAEYALEESHFLWVSTGQVEDMKRGIAPYRDLSESMGLARSSWGWDTRLADFDNDGWLEAIQATGFMRGSVNRWPELHEIAMGNDQLLRHARFWPRFKPGDDLNGWDHNPFYVRSQQGRYFDLAAEIGLGHPQVTRGLATADVDADGDLDFLTANQWESSYLYRNDSRGGNAFLGLRLRLPVEGGSGPGTQVVAGHVRSEAASRPAIGAQATVRLADGRILVSQVDGGSGHSGVCAPELHFGIGARDSSQELSVELRWRDSAGTVQSDSIRLKPGWHTVLLSSTQDGGVE